YLRESSHQSRQVLSRFNGSDEQYEVVLDVESSSCFSGFMEMRGPECLACCFGNDCNLIRLSSEAFDNFAFDTFRRRNDSSGGADHYRQTAARTTTDVIFKLFRMRKDG